MVCGPHLMKAWDLIWVRAHDRTCTVPSDATEHRASAVINRCLSATVECSAEFSQVREISRAAQRGACQDSYTDMCSAHSGKVNSQIMNIVVMHQLSILGIALFMRACAYKSSVP